VSGAAVVCLNPSEPDQDLLAAEVALPNVQKLLAFCGLDRADVLPVVGVVRSWVWQGVQRVSFALVSHAWYVYLSIYVWCVCVCVCGVCVCV
jgi:hypothetical protein